MVGQFQANFLGVAQPSEAVVAIAALDSQLMEQYQRRIRVDPWLSRAIVSFQASKNRPAYRWFKYKEAFSSDLVGYLLSKYGLSGGRLLDPFAGSGTALFASTKLGFGADGIELLPIATELIRGRIFLQDQCTGERIEGVKTWVHSKQWEKATSKISLQSLKITTGAYPPHTVDTIERYLGASETEEAFRRTCLRMALLCVLESVSYTRKDGQYLRWDNRSGRHVGKKPFSKGRILPFDDAIALKIDEILSDLSNVDRHGSDGTQGQICLFPGSCLRVMPQLTAASYDVVFTSPPYCNRYDYTRTYALELAALGLSEAEVVDLRQEMLTSTVENRPKQLVGIKADWQEPISIVDKLEPIQSIIGYLESQKSGGMLNNSGIPRVIKGYFYEMACVIAECSRLLRTGGFVFMVNDNVRYAAASISVDLILAQVAEALGFEVDAILVLPGAKGNSSQQMGAHGREMLRKCVYVWRKR